MATATSLLTALSRAYVLAETHAGGSPELVGALKDFREIHEELGWQTMRVDGHGFNVLEEAIPAQGEELISFRDALREAQITEVRFQEALEPEVLEGFLRRLHPSSAEETVSAPERFRGLEEVLGLSYKNVSAPIRGMAGGVQDLFGPPDPAPPVEPPIQDAPAEPAASEGEPAQAPPIRDLTNKAPSTHLRAELEEAVRLFPEAQGDEKSGLLKTIREKAAELKEARAMAPLVELVEVLASPVGAAAHPESLELALEILNPSIASHLAARLGEIRDEDDRTRMIAVSAGLGREMALALSDALGEARDRYQRRSFMDAMLAQGPLALEVAQGMVDDPRWFVVRNGVSLLGEMGGEDAVSHLTGTLANTDPRVRRETVLALAKLGGEDAEQLLLGMLDDQEAEVRAKACRAVGVLGVEKALKTLMRILSEDQDEDIQVECLQALGKIGDPGAVPLIEKRAVKGLFSRPSQEIRVAAYRALAGIGTPHAKSLLEKAADDSDPGVRTVVQALLA
jgi:HEAT repeat protein